MRTVGSQSMVDELKFVVMKRPQDSHRGQAAIDDQWQNLHYLHRQEYAQVCREFDGLLALVENSGAEIGFLPAHSETGLHSIYTDDPLVVGNRGAILCTMGKAARQGEPDAFAAYLQAAGVPIVGRIEPPGTVEGHSPAHGPAGWQCGRGDPRPPAPLDRPGRLPASALFHQPGGSQHRGRLFPDDARAFSPASAGAGLAADRSAGRGV